MSRNNKKNFMKENSTYVLNINRTSKNIKSNIMTNFICLITNNVTTLLDLQIIEQYIKNANYINSNKVKSLRLFQSKLYLKIINLLYL